MDTTSWIILIIGAAVFCVALFAAHNTIPTALAWWIAFATVSVVTYRAFDLATSWGLLLALVLVISLVACIAHSTAGTIALMVSVAMLIAVVGVSSALGQPVDDEVAAPEKDAKIENASDSTPKCDEMFVQVPSDNAGNKVDAQFETKLATAMAESGDISDAEKTTMLKGSADNGQRLAIWTAAFGLSVDPNNWTNLVDGDCLSAEGQTLYTRFDGALSAKGTTFEVVDVPANAYNSGVSNGTFGVASAPGITGNMKAIKVTLADGSVVYIMVRCGNVAYLNKPDLPEVPTDQPEPTPPSDNPPSDNPPSDTPPGDTPKSSDPLDYQAPGRDATTDSGTGTKPRVPVVTKPAEVAPPVVVTAQPGGGGVIDTPTNKPGAETGVSAPGAAPAVSIPAPSPEPSVNPVDGGDNTTDPGLPAGMQ